MTLPGWTREPLVHFLVAGAALYIALTWGGTPVDPASRVIDVGAEEQAQIALLDVAPVLAQVHRDAVGPAQNRLVGRPDGVRLNAATGLADGRRVIDVHAQAKVMGHYFSARLPGLVIGIADSFSGTSSSA